jgi:two-component system chemotaxis sensor kinase CheA
MLPIGTTFNKYRRLVRDLSAELGKQIDLVTSGEETELDKTVIERLGDPLVHLLRNSIDHGVEPPEERLAAGKPPRGTVRLTAEHSGGAVIIRIVDDGRGLDARAIRVKAVERGLISPDAELSEKELYNLIFLPGFSTARVTSVSAGCGHGVVKRGIESCAGVEIDSQRPRTVITVACPDPGHIDAQVSRRNSSWPPCPLGVRDPRSKRPTGSPRQHAGIVPYIRCGLFSKTTASY